MKSIFTKSMLFILSIVFSYTTLAMGQDSCSLLTRADIQAVVGQSVGEGKLNKTANPAVGRPCEYIIGTSGVFSILATALRPGETPAKVRAELQRNKIAVSDGPKIGDGSFFSSPGYGMIQFNAFKGSKYLIITMLIRETSEATQKAAAEKLMKKALKKL